MRRTTKRATTAAMTEGDDRGRRERAMTAGDESGR
jgi:hypothetical protein